jgi:hypothetical protein
MTSPGSAATEVIPLLLYFAARPWEKTMLAVLERA